MFCLLALIGATTAFAWLPRGVPGGGAPPASVQVPWYFNDGVGAPIETTLNAVTNLLDTSTGAQGTLWLAWQTSRTLNGLTQKYSECATLNLDTNVYNGPYICSAASDLALNDPHGVPALAMDASGYVYVFFGNIETPTQISSTANPRDPSHWVTQTSYAGSDNSTSFSQPRSIAGSIWHFYTGGPPNAAIFVAGETTSEYVKMVSSSGGVPVWGSPVKYIDLTAEKYWTFNPGFQVVGTKAYTAPDIFHVLGTSFGDPIGDVYFYSVDTANGNLSNFDGTTVTGLGSQPINLQTLQDHYRVVSNIAGGFSNGPPAFWYDAPNNIAHIIYAQSTCPNTGCTVTLQYVNLTLSGGHTVVSTPLTLYTFASTGASAKYFRGNVMPNGSGGITAIFPDATYAPGVFHNQGNMLLLNRTAGGTWDASPTVLQSRTGYGLNAVPVTHTVANAVAPTSSMFGST